MSFLFFLTIFVTLELHYAEIGLLGRHSVLPSEASGALGLTRENPGDECLVVAVLITASGLLGEKPLV